MKTSEQLDRPPTSYHENEIWTAFPSTIRWLQSERKIIQTPIERAQNYRKHRGTNATIILLSAACVEGFLVECLKSFAIGYRFSQKDTIEGRLDHDLLKRISTARFREFPDLFRLMLGKPISELVPQRKLIEGVKVLIDFRNGIAHARSIIYETRAEDLEDDVEYEIEKQYKEVHNYLQKENLVYRDEEIFNDKTADHFAGLVKPYVDAVVSLLPAPQSDNVKALINFAFKSS